MNIQLKSGLYITLVGEDPADAKAMRSLAQMLGNAARESGPEAFRSHILDTCLHSLAEICATLDYMQSFTGESWTVDQVIKVSLIELEEKGRIVVERVVMRLYEPNY